MADSSVGQARYVPQLPARMLWMFAMLMLWDVIYFRHLEPVDPGRTFRHGVGALAIAAVGVPLSKGSRKAYWAALVWSSIMAIVSWSGVILIFYWDQMPFGESASKVSLPCGAALLTITVMSLVSPAARQAFLGGTRKA